MREGHRQVGLPLGALVLVLLEDDRVEFGSALIEGVESFAEAGDVLTRGQREGEADAAGRHAVAERGLTAA